MHLLNISLSLVEMRVSYGLKCVIIFRFRPKNIFGKLNRKYITKKVFRFYFVSDYLRKRFRFIQQIKFVELNDVLSLHYCTNI